MGFDSCIYSVVMSGHSVRLLFFLLLRFVRWGWGAPFEAGKVILKA